MIVDMLHNYVINNVICIHVYTYVYMYICIHDMIIDDNNQTNE